MINLLPEKQKKEFERDQMYRVVMILGTISIAGLICLALMLFTAKIYFMAKLEEKRILAEGKNQTIKMMKIKEDEERISSYNVNFSTLKMFYNKQANISLMIKELSDSLPPGISFSYLDYSGGKVSISGFCPDRESLVNFKNNLEKQANFKKINFPANDWVEQRNIDFSLNFEYVFKQ